MLKEEDVWVVVMYQEIGGLRAGFLEDLTSTIFGQGSAWLPAMASEWDQQWAMLKKLCF